MSSELNLLLKLKERETKNEYLSGGLLPKQSILAGFQCVCCNWAQLKTHCNNKTNVTFFVDNSFLVLFLYNFHVDFFFHSGNSLYHLVAASLVMMWVSFFFIVFNFYQCISFLLSCFIYFYRCFCSLLMVDANSYRESTTDFSVKRCNGYFFLWCSRFCLPLCCVIAPWLALAQWMHSTCLCYFVRIFFLLYQYLLAYSRFLVIHFPLFEKRHR